MKWLHSFVVSSSSFPLELENEFLYLSFCNEFSFRNYFALFTLKCAMCECSQLHRREEKKLSLKRFSTSTITEWISLFNSHSINLHVDLMLFNSLVVTHIIQQWILSSSLPRSSILQGALTYPCFPLHTLCFLVHSVTCLESISF